MMTARTIFVLIVHAAADAGRKINNRSERAAFNLRRPMPNSRSPNGFV